MISATSVPSSSTAQPGVVLAVDEAHDQATAADAADFVAQLQAVLSGQAQTPLSEAQDAEDPEVLALTAAATDPLQNVPTPPLPQEVVAAIFAAPAASVSADASLADAAAVTHDLMVSPAGTANQDAAGLQLPGLPLQPDADAPLVLPQAAAAEALAQAEIDKALTASPQSVQQGLEEAPAVQSAPKGMLAAAGAIPQAEALPVATLSAQANIAPGTSTAQPQGAGQSAQAGHLLLAEPLPAQSPTSALSGAQPGPGLADATASPADAIDSAAPLLQPQSMPPSEATAMEATAKQAMATQVAEDQPGVNGSQNALQDAGGMPLQGQPAIGAAQPAFAGGVSSAITSALPDLDATHRAPVEPHQMRLDSGPVQVEVLKLLRQGGGQILLELTPPDQGTYRLDLRLDAQGRAHLVVEGASDSVRTRLEQGEAGLREQLSQMGLSLDLNYRHSDRQHAADRSGSGNGEASATGVDAVASQVDSGAPSLERARQRLERGLVHLYA